MVAFLAVEIAIGVFAFQVETNLRVSIIAVGALVLAVFIMIHFSAPDLRGYVAYRSAVRRWKRTGANKELSVFPFPATRTFKALTGTGLVVGVALLMFGFRMWVAGRTQGGVAGDIAGDMVVPVVLVVLLVGGMLVFFFEAPDYTEKQYAELDRVRAEFAAAVKAVEEARTQIHQLEAPNAVKAVDTYDQDLVDAKTDYAAAVEAARQRVFAEANALTAQRSEFLDARAFYRAAHKAYESAVSTARATLMDLVDRHVYETTKGKEAPLSPDEGDREATRALFRDMAQLQYDGDPEFLSAVVDASFEVELPLDEQFTDFEGLIDRIWREMNPEPEPVEELPPMPSSGIA